MKKNITIELKRILNNKTLGSSELASLLNRYFFSIRDDKSKIMKSFSLVKNELGYFTTIKSYLNELDNQIKAKGKRDLEKFFIEYSGKTEKETEIIFNKIKLHLAKVDSVLTLSRSGTVLGILKLWYKINKNLKVVVCESRPKFEGRLTAKELSDIRIEVELITDAMIGIYILKVDAVLIGADSILRNSNVVNKVGSHALALLCKEFKKPFYVVTTKSKYSNKNIFRHNQEDPNEIWSKRVKNLSISNIYFEEVPKKLITKIFTD